MMPDQYQCCFCGEGIADDFPDPCGVALTAGFRLPSDNQVTQGFFCHFKCFEEKLHSSVPFYAKDLLESCPHRKPDPGEMM